MARSFFSQILLFKSRRGGDAKLNSEPSWSVRCPEFTLNPEEVRFLVVRESHHGHNTLLFDSKATQKLHPPFPPDEQLDSFDGYAYRVAHPSSPDVKFLAEMMMGTIPLSNQKDAFKVSYES